MSNAPADQLPLVLRVIPERPARASSRDGVAWVHELTATASYVVETCPDVYRALARIGRDTEQRLCAVLVCVDDLTPAEHEFFTLVSRVRSDIAIGVCGGRRPAIERSLALGAREIDGADALDQLLRLTCDDGVRGVPNGTPRAFASVDVPVDEDADARVTCPPSADDGERAPEALDVCDADSMPPGTPSAVVLAGTEAEDSVDDGEIVDERVDDAGVASGSARVPWLSYEDGPQRAGPQRPSPGPDSDRTVDDSARRAPTPYEPLLTDEELRALIGDDLGSLGPERGQRDASAGEA